LKNLFIEKLKNFLFFQDIFTQLDEFRAFELNIFILTLVIDLIYQLFYTRVETEL